MAEINVTGHADIDQATAEIAAALRDASKVPGPDEWYYDEAARLRDAIMAGTRELDTEDTDRYDREAVDEFKRTGATHTHVARSGNRVHSPGSRCPGAVCYAMAVNEIDQYAGPNGNERPGEHWNARLIREAAEASDDRNLREHIEGTDRACSYTQSHTREWCGALSCREA